MLRRTLVACLTVAASGGALAAPALAGIEPYRTNDYGGFRDVLPPGANGRATLLELAAFLADGARPPHNDDQLGMYEGLLSATPGVTATTVLGLFKDESFGIAPGDQTRAYSPRPDVSIARDGYGVPHVYGTTRSGAMFGLGYVGAEDRLFLMDALRHAGRAELSAFAGGASGNRSFDADTWRQAPYTEADLQRQYDQLDDLYGDEGRKLQADGADYVAGVNQYIAEARTDLTKMPGEYAAIGRPLEAWKVTDVIATAALVGGIFGDGGGSELAQMELRRAFVARYGSRRGLKLWREWAAFEDADAPTTVRGKRFPYQTPPRKPVRDAIADAGSLRTTSVVLAATGSAAGGRQSAGLLDGLLGTLLPGADGRRAMSNALVVSGAESASGHPLALFGPQVGYFAPQILMEEDVHAPGIDARGASFAGVNLYVQLGRGRDYAFSATSAGQDIVDTFALDLCERDATKPTLRSTSYMFRGSCVPIEVLHHTNNWEPTLADDTAKGSVTLRAERTKLGLVTARATIRGKPVIYTRLRSTYMHELDSARGFADFNDPDRMRNARDFGRAASKIGYTFNWLYADDRDIAYFNSGDNPRRAQGTTGQLPMAAKYEWRDWDPERFTAKYTSFAEHPQVINRQKYLTSWNNKQAPGFAGADTNLYSSVYRSQMLDRQIEPRIAGARKLTMPGLVDAMGEAATTDLRAELVLPLALAVIGTPSDPRLADAVAKLRDWIASGSHRRDRNGDGRYEHADAIRILDAFWPLWMRAEFEPSLGEALFDRLVAAHELDNEPNNGGDHLGSAYQTGWYGYAAKDLRRILGRSVKAPYTKRYCGAGRRARCRILLTGALSRALDVSPAKLYADADCARAGRAADQSCFDAIAFRATGAVTQPMIAWQNRPTYQQAVEIPAHRPR